LLQHPAESPAGSPEPKRLSAEKRKEIAAKAKAAAKKRTAEAKKNQRRQKGHLRLGSIRFSSSDELAEKQSRKRGKENQTSKRERLR
jgi:hypothetical protein